MRGGNTISDCGEREQRFRWVKKDTAKSQTKNGGKQVESEVENITMAMAMAMALQLQNKLM